MIEVSEVRKTYRKSGQLVHALDGVSLSIEAGEFVALRGPSGSGKSTMLMALGGMARPSAGTVTVAGQDLYALSGSARARFRADNIGFVFQMFHLIPYLTVLENVKLPRTATTKPAGETEAVALLERFGLGDRLRHRPSELSTGERQRTALARALLNSPELILADEPTGNLDPANAAEVMRYLSEFHQEGGTVVLVTHSQEAAAAAQRVVVLEKGRLATDS